MLRYCYSNELELIFDAFELHQKATNLVIVQYNLGHVYEEGKVLKKKIIIKLLNCLKNWLKINI
jgi:hypothetical protein